MNVLEETDEETALFLEEMRQEKLRAHLHRAMHDETMETLINRHTLLRLMQRHNEAMALLQEFLALNPENSNSDLVRRTHRLTAR